MPDDHHRGSCLCGAVRFELRAPVTELLNCHCRMCQKAHGAPFATFARVAHEDFTIVQGADRLACYRSSAEARRTFCSECGSALQFIRDDRATFGLAVSALDTPVAAQPAQEYFTESRASWLERSS